MSMGNKTKTRISKSLNFSPLLTVFSRPILYILLIDALFWRQ